MFRRTFKCWRTLWDTPENKHLTIYVQKKQVGLLFARFFVTFFGFMYPCVTLCTTDLRNESILADFVADTCKMFSLTQSEWIVSHNWKCIRVFRRAPRRLPVLTWSIYGTSPIMPFVLSILSNAISNRCQHDSISRQYLEATLLNHFRLCIVV